MNISLSDVLIHIDEALDPGRRQDLETQLRAIDGVVSVKNPEDRLHLTLVGYIAAKVNAQHLLKVIRGAGMHAELVGL